ncbi:MAG: LytTR family DNA-binding domain-containing protein [Pseudobutyrivibrio sp.]|nr:LytTR family DNA-binding domain-containing protein [Pseudobutyrivibrio sp.]
MFTIAICDDNKEARIGLSKMVESILVDKKTEYEILAFSSGEELLKAIDGDDIKIELLLLDIEMPGISGIETKDALEKNKKVTNVVFVTNHMEVMVDAFGAKVLGFLKKPVNLEDLSRRIEKVYKDYVDNVLVEVSKEVFVRRNDISYIKASGNYCDLFCVDGRRIKAIRNSLSHFKDSLGENFIQIHRAILVNALEIIKSRHNQIVLSTGEEFSISRSYIEAFKRKYHVVAINSMEGRF